MLNFRFRPELRMPGWKSIPFPDQIKRLLIIFIILVIMLITVRNYLMPPTFVKEGHYRAAAIDSILALPIHYAGQEACSECHDEYVALKQTSYHQNVACEVCHGPGANHVEDPSENTPSAPRQRGLCPLCHIYNASKPTGFPQINIVTHNPLEPCMSCHEPHDPKPPQPPEECGACHGEIARTKAVSHHAALECTQCHSAPEAHKKDPRSFRPSKPRKRTFCGGCHGENAESAGEIPRVDLQSHEPDHACWQCHYPHYPEVR